MEHDELGVRGPDAWLLSLNNRDFEGPSTWLSAVSWYAHTTSGLSIHHLQVGLLLVIGSHNQCCGGVPCFCVDVALQSGITQSR